MLTEMQAHWIDVGSQFPSLLICSIFNTWQVSLLAWQEFFFAQVELRKNPDKMGFEKDFSAWLLVRNKYCATAAILEVIYQGIILSFKEVGPVYDYTIKPR